jgi:hypothetical protein
MLRPLFTPPPPLPPGKTWYPLYRRLGGCKGRSGVEISPPLEFDPRTFQPVAGCYTDYATRPTEAYELEIKEHTIRATLFVWVFNILHFSASYGHHWVFQITKYFEDGIIAMVIFSGGVRSYSLWLK